MLTHHFKSRLKSPSPSPCSDQLANTENTVIEKNQNNYYVIYKKFKLSPNNKIYYFIFFTHPPVTAGPRWSSVLHASLANTGLNIIFYYI